MKILFIDFTLPYLLKDSNSRVGGWAVELHAWIEGLNKLGHRVGVLTWKGANNYVGRELDFDLLETFDPDKGIRVLKYFYTYIPSIYRQTKKFKPDAIIQACAMLNTGIMSSVAVKLHVPFIYRVANDMDTDERYKARLPKYAQIAYRYGLKKSNGILCQNNYQYNNLKTIFQDKPMNTLMNPFAGEIITFSSRSSFKKRKYIAWIGNFKSQKNIPLLYKIALKLPDIQFKVAGMPVSNMDDETADTINKLSLCRNVEFVGYLLRHDVPAFLSKSKALLNTSHYEGFSNTFLEAFASGTPVIAPTHVDPNQIISINDLGLASSNDTLYLKVKKLFEDEIKFENMSFNCIRYISVNHDPVRCAKRMVDFIAEIKGYN